MLGFQAAGAAPIVSGKIVDHPETIATAIKIGNPASWKQAVAARDESKGLIDSVTDVEILDAYKRLASRSGVFVEPASAASVAGMLKLHQAGYFKKHKGALIVCTLTGHGLKDPDIAIKNVQPPVSLKPEVKAILKEIGL
jgi:threonine synthase